MKSVLAWALAGAVAAAVATSSGCATAPDPSETVQTGADIARGALAKALYYARFAVEATNVVCGMDPEGEPCNLLVDALSEFYKRAVQVEAAINIGEGSVEDVEALESTIKNILAAAQKAARSFT